VVSADGYAGPPERKYFNVRVSQTPEGDRLRYEAARPLGQDMLFQAAITITKGFARPGFILTLAGLDRRSGGALTAFGVFCAGLMLTIGYFVVIWRRVGRDPKPGPAPVQVEPLPGLSPALAGYVMSRGRLKTPAVAATLVRLAQAGAVTIDGRGGAYRIARCGAPSGCAAEEEAFFTSLFSGRGAIDLDGRHARRLLRALARPMEKILRQKYGKYYSSNSRYLWRFAPLLLAAAFAGYCWVGQPPGQGGQEPRLAYAAVAGGASLLALYVFYRLLRAPTHSGRKLMDAIAGFKKFLAANYGQARLFDYALADEAPQSLEQPLPWAIALGIDSEYVTIRQRSLGWYAGRQGSFSPREFAGCLGHHGG
jgi:hypothetical protein